MPAKPPGVPQQQAHRETILFSDSTKIEIATTGADTALTLHWPQDDPRLIVLFPHELAELARAIARAQKATTPPNRQRA